MSKCKDCKYCDLEDLEHKTWYCENLDVLMSAVNIHDLPMDSGHTLFCFEKKGGT